MRLLCTPWGMTCLSYITRKMMVPTFNNKVTATYFPSGILQLGRLLCYLHSFKIFSLEFMSNEHRMFEALWSVRNYFHLFFSFDNKPEDGGYREGPISAL